MPRKRRVSKERRSRLWAFFWEWSDEWDADDDLDLSVFGREIPAEVRRRKRA